MKTASRPDVANFGLVRPPLVYFTSIATGWVLHLVRPLPFLPDALATPLGILLVVVASGLFLSAVRTFRAAGTPVPGDAPTTVIVRTGPYRFTRNPIYLAFSLLQLGVASWVNSLWLIVTLVAAVGVMAFVVIPREERYLEGRFRAAYVDYRASTRRWL